MDRHIYSRSLGCARCCWTFFAFLFNRLANPFNEFFSAHGAQVSLVPGTLTSGRGIGQFRIRHSKFATNAVIISSTQHVGHVVKGFKRVFDGQGSAIIAPAVQFCFDFALHQASGRCGMETDNVPFVIKLKSVISKEGDQKNRKGQVLAGKLHLERCRLVRGAGFEAMGVNALVFFHGMLYNVTGYRCQFTVGCSTRHIEPSGVHPLQIWQERIWTLNVGMAVVGVALRWGNRRYQPVPSSFVICQKVKQHNNVAVATECVPSRVIDIAGLCPTFDDR
mmetsp:Transcript_34466/g.71769  ORF Transcript_34466/g.71769 Transcript_34466/m.71769 type:complete len:278 (-) Transcript_34466:1529-2362(-)